MRATYAPQYGQASARFVAAWVLKAHTLGPFALVLASPIATYVLDLRLAQLLGDRDWLDTFRVFQTVHITAVLASTALLPQVLVPKVLTGSDNGNINWRLAWRLHKYALCLGLLAFAAVLAYPEHILALLLDSKSTAPTRGVLTAARIYFSAIGPTILVGISASCMLALGFETALYLAPAVPTACAIAAIEVYGSATTLVQVCALSAFGALLMCGWSGALLYRKYLRTPCCTTALNRGEVEPLLTKGDIEQLLALLATQGSAIVLNRVLTRGQAGAVSNYVFAFKIASVAMLPCIVSANRLLKSLGTEYCGSGRAPGRGTVRAVFRSYVYGFGLSALLLSVDSHVVRVAFFNARFTEQQYAQIGAILRLLALGLPAVAQVLIWTRVNAVRKSTQSTLSSAMAVLFISVGASQLDPAMAVYRVAGLWALGVTVQAILLLAANRVQIDYNGTAQRAKVYLPTCVAVGTAVWAWYAFPQHDVALLGGLNLLLLAHFGLASCALLAPARSDAPQNVP